MTDHDWMTSGVTPHGPSVLSTAETTPVPGPTPFLEQSALAKLHAERDAQVRALAKAASVASSLGGAIDALKVAIARNDTELAAPCRVKIQILAKRLEDALSDPGSVRGINPTNDTDVDPKAGPQ